MSVPSARRLSAQVVGVVVVLLAGLGLNMAHQDLSAPLPERAAIRAALSDVGVSGLLRQRRWDRVTTTAVDDQLERVRFFDHGRAVAEGLVSSTGAVSNVSDFVGPAVPYGSPTAYEPTVLFGLGLLFVLMAGVAPLWRLRNLDVAAALLVVVPVLLLQHGFLDGSVFAAMPGLAYLMFRCAWIGLGPGGRARASTPLFMRITNGWDARVRVRVMRALLVALALVFAMVGLSSPGAMDVLQAVMEGATNLVHGVLPYGHMPGDIFHGDTYPLLSYLLYMPVAWIAPVHSTWDSVDTALGVTVMAALVAGLALFRTVAGHRSQRTLEAEASGLHAALTWLCFPPLLIAVSAGTTDVVLAAIVLFAVVLWRRPALSCGVLAAAGWFKLVPFALVPVWLAPLRGRRLGTAIASIAAVSLAMIGILLVLGGPHGPAAMVKAIFYQFARGSTQNVWNVLGIKQLQPLGQACVLGLIAAAVIRLRREPQFATSQPRMAALAAAILVGLQLVSNHWSFLYDIWIVPLVGLSLLHPASSVSSVARLVSEPSRHATDRILQPRPLLGSSCKPPINGRTATPRNTPDCLTPET